MTKRSIATIAAASALVGASVLTGTAVQAAVPAAVPTVVPTAGPLSAASIQSGFDALAAQTQAAQGAAQVAQSASEAAASTGTSSAAAEWAASSKARAVVQCESTGNYAVNTGNGYYGGWQFLRSSWLANGGGQYADYPHLATKEQQDQVAYTYWLKAGWGPWACA